MVQYQIDKLRAQTVRLLKEIKVSILLTRPVSATRLLRV